MSQLLAINAAHVDRMVATAAAILGRLAPSPAAPRPDSPSAPDRPELARAVGRRGALVDALMADHDQAAAIDERLPDLLLAERFGLDEMDLSLLWFVVAPHLEPALHDLVARANDDVRFTEIDLALVLRAFADERTEQMALLGDLGPSGRLIERGLIEFVIGDRAKKNRLFANLHPGDHVVSFLSGQRAISPAALPYCDWIAPALTLDDLHLPAAFLRDVVPVVSAFQRRASLRDGWLGPSGLRAYAGLGIVLRGSDGAGRATAIRALAGTLGRQVLQVDGRVLALATPEEQRACLRSVLREGELFGDLVCIRDAAKLIAPGSPAAPILARELERRAVACLFCTSEEALDPILERAILIKHAYAPSLSQEQAATTWMLSFPSATARLTDASFEALAKRISLSPQQMRKANQLAYLATEEVVREDDHLTALVSGSVLERAAKAQVNRHIGGLATLTDPTLTMRDLILDEKTETRIAEVIAAARNRETVLNDWGLGARIHRGTGLVSLFDGDPGTGKTHAAEVIASELGLSLVHVSVAAVVSKYIGETEKNLHRIFDEARPDMSLLLFDEADSLFSKRTKEVERSTDRYSNMDINVMLQLIERYPGITILTTNLKKAIDPAFERRFAFKITFDRPEHAERVRIWRYFLGAEVTTAEPIDFDRVAEVSLSGGEIKNALLRASYEAARHAQRLTTKGLVIAAETEAAAAGRLVRTHA